MLVERLLAEGWSAGDTRGRVAATQDAYEAVPAGERDTLDPQELVVGAAARALLEPRDQGCIGLPNRRWRSQSSYVTGFPGTVPRTVPPWGLPGSPFGPVWRSPANAPAMSAASVARGA